MSELSESRILVDVFDNVRGLTKFYLKLAKDLDPHQVLTVNGQQLNSLYWLIGHLVWSEHFLLVQGMNGERMDIQWLDRFDEALGERQPSDPSLEEILATLDNVHERAKAIILNYSSSDLDEPNAVNVAFATGNSRRVLIQHAIRHEPMHTGHISWICKINGVSGP